MEASVLKVGFRTASFGLFWGVCLSSGLGADLRCNLVWRRGYSVGRCCDGSDRDWVAIGYHVLVGADLVDSVEANIICAVVGRWI